MQTHRDSDFYNEMRQEWLDTLKAKADRMSSERQSEITAGTDEETPLNTWKSRGVEVRELPADEHGILRISVGGGEDTPVSLNYCVFRGNHGKCVDLLRKALIALQEGPQD